MSPQLLGCALDWKRKPFKCRACDTEMRATSTGGDLFSMTVYYCDNNKCARYGDLTIAGVMPKKEGE